MQDYCVVHLLAPRVGAFVVFLRFIVTIELLKDILRQELVAPPHVLLELAQYLRVIFGVALLLITSLNEVVVTLDLLYPALFPLLLVVAFVFLYFILS